MSNQKASLASRIVNNVKNLLSLDSRPRLARSNHTNSRHEFIIVGLGRFGTSLAMALTAYNHQVLAIDLDKKRVQQVAHLLPHVVQMDATDIDALREVGAESFDTGIICTGSVFEANLLATVNLRKLGVRRVIIRTGIVLSTESGALPITVLPFKFFAGGPLGNGEQWWPWIHLDDEVRAIRFLLESETAVGPYNLCTPNPLKNKAFAKVIGNVMNRPAFFPTPAFALKLALGEIAAIVLDGRRAVPQKLEEAGFTFKYPQAAEALRDLLNQ